ncbi:glycosyltransferase [candidate division KSB1 bacterium]|nr:glycosyltransferase [candidate division KSB1 bacterium]
MTIFFFIYVFLGMVLAVTIYNAFTAPLVKKGPMPTTKKKVSLLVPARNEEYNIATCLASLGAQDYADFEIIVLDDHSIDGTVAVVENFMSKDNRIRLLRGESLPKGWTGKNWACHQLSLAAQGDILLFTDADNYHASDAVSRTVGWMEKLGLHLFSAFPQQITKTWGEKLVVPVFDLFVYSFLPMWQTYYSRYPSLAAANGQWIAFTRSGYQKSGGHASVKNQIVEDVAISRKAKKLGLKILTTSGKDAVFGRMYHSFFEVWYGFSKNAFGLMNFQVAPYFILLAFMLIAFFMPYVLIFYRPFLIYATIAIALNVLLRAIVAVKYRQPLVFSVLLHPIGILLTITVALSSFYYYLLGDILWKDRPVPLR